MAKLKLTGKQIRAIGYDEGPVISVAMHTMCTHFKHASEEEALQILKDILVRPEAYIADEKLGKISQQLMDAKAVVAAEGNMVQLNGKGIQYNIFGAEHIEEGALTQMQMAARLPVSVAGALMPD